MGHGGMVRKFCFVQDFLQTVARTFLKTRSAHLQNKRSALHLHTISHVESRTIGIFKTPIDASHSSIGLYHHGCCEFKALRSSHAQKWVRRHKWWRRWRRCTGKSSVELACASFHQPTTEEAWPVKTNCCGPEETSGRSHAASQEESPSTSTVLLRPNIRRSAANHSKA